MPGKIFLRESIRVQLFCWPLYYLLMLLINSKIRPETGWQNQLMAWLILLFAFNACLAIMYIIFSRKMIWVSFFSAIGLYVLLSEWTHRMGWEWVHFKGELFSTKREQYYWMVFANYLGVWIMAASLLFHIKSRISDRLRQQEAELRHQKEIEAKEMQFALHTVQISPHFLFNVLGGMRYRIQELLPEVAGDMDKLNDLMRYTLSASEEGKKHVLLYKEIEALECYIDLERMRFENTYVEYIVEGTPLSHKIVPVSLITLVENAFKYGIYTDEHTPIQVKLLITDEEVLFECTNKIDHARTRESSLGTGHKNLRSRLEIAFPGNYHFEAMVIAEDWYYVRLRIKQG